MTLVQASMRDFHIVAGCLATFREFLNYFAFAVVTAVGASCPPQQPRKQNGLPEMALGPASQGCPRGPLWGCASKMGLEDLLHFLGELRQLVVTDHHLNRVLGRLVKFRVFLSDFRIFHF